LLLEEFFLREEDLIIDPDMEEIVQGFVIESTEYLEHLDQDLVSLDENPGDMELVGKVFRAFHTLKGNSRALGFLDMETMVHRTEDVIRKVRDGEARVVPAMMDVLLASVDMVKALLNDISEKKKRERDLAPLIAQLQAVNEDGPAPGAEPAAAATEPSVAAGTSTEKKTAAPTIRVDTIKLDKLLSTAGELVLSKNRLLNFTQRLEQGQAVASPEEFLNEINAQLGFLVSDMQVDVMSTRMQPISRVFSKYPRVVRDLGRETGKEIELVITGQETELDNAIIEEIGDPLIHMVRNSCDHGVEMPDARVAAGKNPKGRVELSAYYEGNFAIISIRDDGKGIDTEVIKRKAIEKKLISPEQAATMAKSDILNLIFLPGFSTAEKVTAVSGRGVGMDVVKNSIGKLKGIIEMDSEKGKGTVLKIKLPLTLASMIGLEIEVGGIRYLVPQEAIVEIVRLPASGYAAAVKDKTFLFRGNYTLPVVNVRDMLINGNKNAAPVQQGYLIVTSEVEKRTGLLVDNVLQQHEVVVKPLGKYLSRFHLSEINGATIMGDGSIELVINASVIAGFQTQGAA